MNEKVSSLDKARQDNRKKNGWTMEEIKNNSIKELKEFKKLAENEPKDLISGDMNKIINGVEDDDKES